MNSCNAVVRVELLVEFGVFLFIVIAWNDSSAVDVEQFVNLVDEVGSLDPDALVKVVDAVIEPLDNKSKEFVEVAVEDEPLSVLCQVCSMVQRALCNLLHKCAELVLIGLSVCYGNHIEGCGELSIKCVHAVFEVDPFVVESSNPGATSLVIIAVRKSLKLCFIVCLECFCGGYDNLVPAGSRIFGVYDKVLQVNFEFSFSIWKQF